MILIIGAGALGSHVALFLRNFHHLKVVDFDKVEQKNTMAQFHPRTMLGRNKTTSLAMSLQGMFGVKIEPVPYAFTATNAGVIIEDENDDVDLILDCTDNLKARKLIQDMAVAYERPCLHGAVSADGTFARIVWGSLFQGDDEGKDGAATCEDGEHLPFFAMVAALMAREAQHYFKAKKQQSFQITPTCITRLA